MPLHRFTVPQVSVVLDLNIYIRSNKNKIQNYYFKRKEIETLCHRSLSMEETKKIIIIKKYQKSNKTFKRYFTSSGGQVGEIPSQYSSIYKNKFFYY